MSNDASASSNPEPAVLDLLVTRGLLTTEQRQQILREADLKHNSALSLLVSRGLLSDLQVAEALGEILGYPVWGGGAEDIDPELWRLARPSFWQAAPIIPLLLAGDQITFAICGLSGVLLGLELANHLGKVADFKLASASQLLSVLGSRKDSHTTVESLWELGEAEFSTDLDIGQADLNPENPDSPIVRFVDYTIARAVREDASDIHIEPLERRLRIRYRIDGVMYDVYSPPKGLEAAVMTRLKLMSSLNIAERRRPQDGRIRVRHNTRTMDIRISFIPTAAGERAVLRLLNPDAALRALDQLGLGDRQQPLINMLSRSQGILLVTGPTGSGKTTTLYAALNHLNSPGHNIISIEDPVEYRLEGINQLAVNRVTGFTFAAGLRSILRQDPDIILVGEIRDQETAAIAIQAAMTGHLVLSTLHTNDSTSAVSRLIDMEIEPFRIAETLTGALGQRLARTICQFCVEEYQPASEVLTHFAQCRNFGSAGTFIRGKGCGRCRNTGFKGRTGIFEIMDVDDEVIQLIRNAEMVATLRQHMMGKGMMTLEEDGWLKVVRGLTSPDEILRVIRSR